MSHKLKLTFLGTGTSQGIPVIGSDHPVNLSNNPKDKRLRSSVLISTENTNIVIDCGPDFRQQLLANPVKKLDAVVFTHEHADHTMGIDDIRPFFFRQGDIPIFAHQRVIKALQRRFDYVFDAENKYPGAPAVAINYIEKDTLFTIGELTLEPIEVWHNESLTVFGFRMEDLVYITDMKSIKDDQFYKLRSAKVLIINALRRQPHRSHLNLEEAIAFAQKVGAEQTYFTHISHLLGFHDQVEAELPDGIHLAYDNFSIQL